jgi:hypothetical protein
MKKVLSLLFVLIAFLMMFGCKSSSPTAAATATTVPTAVPTVPTSQIYYTVTGTSGVSVSIDYYTPVPGYGSIFGGFMGTITLPYISPVMPFEEGSTAGINVQYQYNVTTTVNIYKNGFLWLTNTGISSSGISGVIP